MKLFIVSTPDYGYDEYDSHVISAKTPEDAVALANLPGNKETWNVKYIGSYYRNISKVIHSSFNAG